MKLVKTHSMELPPATPTSPDANVESSALPTFVPLTKKSKCDPFADTSSAFTVFRPPLMALLDVKSTKSVEDAARCGDNASLAWCDVCGPLRWSVCAVTPASYTARQSAPTGWNLHVS